VSKSRNDSVDCLTVGVESHIACLSSTKMTTTRVWRADSSCHFTDVNSHSPTCQLSCDVWQQEMMHYTCSLLLRVRCRTGRTVD